uniref:Secreted protein acidic and cysteine rich n=1 Tax=Macaca fascicularis TaxID=9541 RepID=A0A2K5WMZ6_MACFA
MRAWIFFLLCLAGRALAAPVMGTILPILLSQFQVSVGANPVQVEVGEFDDGPEETEEEVVAENPCQNHHCKHGKVCELDENNTPMCVCQDPTSCPAPIGECAAMTTRPSTLPATSLPQSAPWRAPRRATSSTWTTSGLANVSVLGLFQTSVLGREL